MSKAILVMDMPESCAKCGLCIIRGTPFCATTHKEIEPKMIMNDKKPDWCPLREVPQKKDTRYSPTRNPYITEGWNACIDEIMKGSE